MFIWDLEMNVKVPDLLPKFRNCLARGVLELFGNVPENRLRINFLLQDPKFLFTVYNLVNNRQKTLQKWRICLSIIHLVLANLGVFLNAIKNIYSLERTRHAMMAL
jgi:hypothetical protein